ncbi:hypothetical protein GGR55DRAFT_98209 [Xylaria sp. FL0064]|nr:hypothetical protein GGR55DRAFT_98209 [Xylaria sp. FL0064]
MAHLPSQHPNLTLHLTDAALTPLITSARAHQHLEYLTALSHTALDAHESAQRLGLGAPQRIMVEHGDGPVLLQTFLSPHAPSSTPTSTPAAPSQTQQHSTTGTTSQPLDPSQQRQRQQQQQHKGALALAVENRGGGGGSATIASHEEEDHSDSTYPEAHHHNDNNNSKNNTNNSSTSPGLIIDIDNDGGGGGGGGGANPNAPPMLLGIIVAATSDDAREARWAAARLERVGREIQGRWTELQQDVNPASGSRRRTDAPQEEDEDAAGD